MRCIRSRRWLVKDHLYTQHTCHTNTHSCKHAPRTHHQCAAREQFARPLRFPTTAAPLSTVCAMVLGGRNAEGTAPPPHEVRLSTLLYQIIEVLLVILLVNCLAYTLVARVPATEAAYHSGQLQREQHSYSDSGSGAASSRSHYRQPHSIGHLAGGAHLGYNSLLQQQHQHQPQQQRHYQPFDDYDELHATAPHQLQTQTQTRSQNFKISPKPCAIGRIEGTCMFVWECIKSEGRHVGMCVDSFMFGSCCAHNYTDNIVLPQPFSYTRPTKPVGISSLNHKPRPPPMPHRPVVSGMTTIERPHGAGTLVIRPSGPHHQGALYKPQQQQPQSPSQQPQHQIKPTTGSNSNSTSSSLDAGIAAAVGAEGTTSRTTSTEDPSLLWTSNAVINDLQSVASVSSPFATSDSMWHRPQHQQQHQQQQHHTAATAVVVSSPPAQAQHHWYLTTEPNFITKPRPPSWDKPALLRPKPSKPTKRPPPPPATQQQQQHQQAATSSIAIYPTRKPTTTTLPAKPTKPAQTPLRPKPTKPPTTTTSSTTSTTTTTMIPFYQKPSAIWQDHHVSTSGYESSSRPTQPTASTTTAHTAPLSTVMPAQIAGTAVATKPMHGATQPPHDDKPHSSTHAPAATAGPMSPTHNINYTSIESNEITDIASDSRGTIKTISAARSECGIPVLARPETRIVGGKSAAFGRWPWQVSVRRTSFFGFSSTHRCGGALINENWIATAGHCVDDLLISQIRIRVGEYDFSHVQEQLPYIERGVAKKVVHPKYNFFTYEYDLALVKLEQPLEFAPHVSPICLPQTDSLLIGMNATVTGWGRLSEGGTLPSVLQEVSVPIVSNDNCKTMFLRAGRQEFIPEIFLCAGYETGGQDSCQGDSGGPLQVKSQDGRFFLAGIISWGIGCAEANLPGVCTRISKFVPWIVENVT